MLTYWFKLPVGGSCVGNTEVVGLGIGVGRAAGEISTVFNNKHKHWNQRCIVIAIKLTVLYFVCVGPILIVQLNKWFV